MPMPAFPSAAFLMGLVTFAEGRGINLNTFQSFDHHMELPHEHEHLNYLNEVFLPVGKYYLL